MRETVDWRWAKYKVPRVYKIVRSLTVPYFRKSGVRVTVFISPGENLHALSQSRIGYSFLWVLVLCDELGKLV